MGETVKAFFTRLCTTYSFIKQNKEVLAKRKEEKTKQWVEGRKRESFRAIAVTTTGLERSYRRSSTGSRNGRQGRKLWLASGDLWWQIIGDKVGAVNTIFFFFFNFVRKNRSQRFARFTDFFYKEWFLEFKEPSMLTVFGTSYKC